ncbi:hypothetical protein SAMN05421823_101178 [Catalinimonas alkaloidigena]|uniref:CBM-cenC domain-containing protein n=1 Tax=Catalinimonas alkaloidigena TaxID=1075417 RepID=A0A1G8WSW8_9BACT|nr:hypothetical protein [Catalinimonas alkaloidigena]SDJ81502.1 hypothetical protein SAMN05421823_101178 [Catalinimonas alkaloidigena]
MSYFRTGMLVLVTAVSLVRCGAPDSRDDAHLITHNDFESYGGWTSLPTLTDERAHSGRYSIKVTPQQPFGPSFSKPVGQFYHEGARRLKLEAYVYRDDPKAHVALIMAVHSPVDNSGLVYEEVAHTGESNAWWKLEKVIELPEGLPEDAKFKLYAWMGDGRGAFYVDDVTLTRLP